MKMLIRCLVLFATLLYVPGLAQTMSHAWAQEVWAVNDYPSPTFILPYDTYHDLYGSSDSLYGGPPS